MIIVRLWGGLGNQMFQYAAGRRLAHVNDDRLKLDISWFGREAAGDTPRRYELGVFSLSAEVATSAEARRLRGPDTRRWPKLLKRLLATLGYGGRRSCIREKHFHFDPEILSLRGNAYLDGYWQSEKYFEDAADVVRNDFVLTAPAQGANESLLREVRGSDSVSVHFRRGDYITNPNAAACHGAATLEYYAAAIAAVRGRVKNPRLFVFSDDLDWVRAHLNPEMPVTFVEGNGVHQPAEDLRLMSACRHHIIANSSFSWWGAWLGENRGKVVVAPATWFHGSDADTRDLIPDRWLRL